MDSWEAYAMSMRKIPPPLPYEIFTFPNALGTYGFSVGNFKSGILVKKEHRVYM